MLHRQLMADAHAHRGTVLATTHVAPLSNKSSMLSMTTATTSAASSRSVAAPARSSSLAAICRPSASFDHSLSERPAPLEHACRPSAFFEQRKSRHGSRKGKPSSRGSLWPVACLFKAFCKPLHARPQRPTSQAVQPVRDESHGPTAVGTTTARTTRTVHRRPGISRSAAVPAPICVVPVHDEALPPSPPPSPCFCALSGAVSTAFEHHPCCPLVNDVSHSVLDATWTDTSSLTTALTALTLRTYSTSAPTPLQPSTLPGRIPHTPSSIADRLRGWAHRGMRAHSPPKHRAHFRQRSSGSLGIARRDAAERADQLGNTTESCPSSPSMPRAWPARPSLPTLTAARPTHQRVQSTELPRAAEIYRSLPLKAQRQLFSPEERLVLAGRPDEVPLRRRFRRSSLCLDLSDGWNGDQSDETGTAVDRNNSSNYASYYHQRASLHRSCPSTPVTSDPSVQPDVHLATLAHDMHSSTAVPGREARSYYFYDDTRARRMLRRFRSRQRFDEMLWFGFAGEMEGEGRTLTVRVTLTPDVARSRDVL
ncbi:hypothetical protein THASP1DRAFT_30635 [Thamnocephalis sphaerospora]|uniref:Uncharacterized protein n=1 Tax=Thamnocephalis sphaerospora TaxID=78915 RepID=A0A4P9XNJ2_9FUNG|nr:hypothetical protein THASP1DRAFT_30635 [Thamnocephalis sphaerospora]|eukprot:RKP07547.1 hypothetical protein THASP1DRAFT_30635 [Thamnocephalis sphaerospora]